MQIMATAVVSAVTPTDPTSCQPSRAAATMEPTSSQVHRQHRYIQPPASQYRLSQNLDCKDSNYDVEDAAYDHANGNGGGDDDGYCF